MTGPFRLDGGVVHVRLGRAERSLLSAVLGIAAARNDAAGRLDYEAHPDDPEAEERFQDLVRGSLTELRSADVARFETVLAGTATPEDLEGFMRVVGEARLVLASRIGIEDDGWEDDLEGGGNPELALLGWLGYLQDAAVEALGELL